MSKTMTVQATVPEKKDDKGVVVQKAVGPFSITLEVPETAAAMITAYGDEAVKTNALANWVVTLQANMRAGMKKGETNAALQARLASAKMGVAASGIKVDPKQAFLAMFQAATPEDQKKMLKELGERAATK